MRRNKALNPAMPRHDYRSALQCAVSWLGDRYVLAQPAPRRPHPDREPFYAETRRWLPISRH